MKLMRLRLNKLHRGFMVGPLEPPKDVVRRPFFVYLYSFPFLLTKNSADDKILVTYGINLQYLKVGYILCRKLLSLKNG